MVGLLTSPEVAREPSLLIKRLEILKERAKRPSLSIDIDDRDERAIRKRWLGNLDVSSFRGGVQALISVGVAVALHMWDVTNEAYNG